MAETTWEKSPSAQSKDKKKRKPGGERSKFLVGAALLLSSIAYLIFSGTMTGARFFITVDEVVNDPQYIGQQVRLSGVVLGETIEYDSATGQLNFVIANIPQEFDDLATALHQATLNPNASRIQISMEEQALPDLLQHEAQAILTGTVGEDGVFYGTELNLKCPSRFDEGVPGDMIHLQQDA